ncbi:MAG: carboxypeptidase-like regulatory domain-containing protein, partial [Myxococcota bacterium]
FALARRTVGADDARVDFRLQPARRLEGSVVNVERAPIANASIELWSVKDDGTLDEAQPPQRTFTDAQGEFVFTRLEEGPLHLRASATGRASVVQRLASATDRTLITLAAAAVVSGQVYGARGGPASGAEVRLVGSGLWPGVVVSSDDSGRFRFDDVPPGLYELHARRGSEVAPTSQGLEIIPGESTFVTLRLIAGVRLAGLVVNDEGAPVEGAELSSSQDGIAVVAQTTTSAADGSFVFDGLLPGPRWVSARAGGHVATSLYVESIDDPLTLTLPRGATLEGIALDARDRPVVGALVQWLGRTRAQRPTGPGLGVTSGPVPPLPLDAVGEANLWTPSGIQTRTDASGRFRLDGIAAGSGEVHVERAGSAPGRSPGIRLAAGQRITDLQIVVPDGGRVEGRVLDARGFPLGSVLVELQSERDPWPRSMMAREDGSFRFDGALGVTVLTARPYELPPARARVNVERDTNVDLIVPTDLTQLALRVFDPDGFPIADASITLQSLQASTPFSRRGRSAPDGTFVFATLPPPPYRVVADHFEFTPTEHEVQTTGDELRIVLRRGGRVEGRVVDQWSRQPIVGAVVSLAPHGERTTNEDGSFLFERVPAGGHTAEARAPGFLPETRSFDHGDARSDLGDLRLAASATFVGVVVDVLGDVVPNATVASGETRTTSGSDGSYRLEVAPGFHVLRTTHPSAGSAESARLQVDPGQESDVRVVLDGRLAPPEEEDASPQFRVAVPIEVERRGGDIVIVRVVGTGGTNALRPGDVLLAIDDEPVFAAAQARAMLRGPDGQQSVIQVRRRGRTRRVVVRRRRFQENR